jgi:hypothetical protein
MSGAAAGGGGGAKDEAYLINLKEQEKALK